MAWPSGNSSSVISQKIEKRDKRVKSGLLFPKSNDLPDLLIERYPWQHLFGTVLLARFVHHNH